jgi:translation initiation factor IF-3
MAFPNKQPYRGNNFRRKNERTHRINEEIKHQSVRVVGEGVESGIYHIGDAIKMAKDLGVDLIEIVSDSNPPVCRVIEYQKFAYEIRKKEKDKSSGKKSELKEIRLSPNIGDHDFGFKVKQAEKFLKNGDKVKVTVKFHGRMIVHKEQGNLVMLRFAEALSEVGKAEQLPKMDGKFMMMFLVPKKK